MKILNSGNVMRLPLDAIDVGARLRQVSEVKLQNLLLMAEDTGITTPIHCRKTAGRYELIDGAHRLEAARRLGQADIAALIVECRQDEARAMEASNNLGAARMSPVQTVVFAASWKRDYYALHPERKPGVFQGNQYREKEVGALNALTKSVADAFGIQRRQAYKILAVGERLSPEESAELDRDDLRVGLTDLVALAKVGDPAERAEIVKAIGAGQRVAKARKAYAAARNGVQPVVKSKVEEAFNGLLTAWGRAGKPARRQFVAAIAPELRQLLDEAAK